MKHFKGTFLLLLVVIAFGAYIYFVEFKQAEEEKKVKEMAEKLFPFDTKGVTAIKIKNSFGDFELEKKGDDWHLTFPLADSADQTSLTTLVNNMGTAKFDSVVVEGEANLAEFGLNDPKTSITLISPDKTTKILVGDNAALSGKMYVKRDGEDKVLFSNSSFKTFIDKSLKDLRDKRVFRKGRNHIAGVELRRRGKPEVKLGLIDGKWNIMGDKNEIADQEAVNKFLGALDNLKATRFASEGGKASGKNRSKFGLNWPRTTLVFFDKANKEIDTVVISKKKGKYYSHVEGNAPIYEVAETNILGFEKGLNDFRDKTAPFKLNKDNIKEISMKTGVVEVDLVKNGNQWDLKLPKDDKIVSQIQVNNLLDKVSQLKVAEFLGSEKPKGLSRPKGALMLKDSDGKVVMDIVWGAKTKSKKSYYTKTNTFDAPFGVATSELDTLPGQTLLETKEAKSDSSPKEKGSGT